MSALAVLAEVADDALDFVLPASLEAHEPVELDGARRDDVRLLVATAHDRHIAHHRLGDLPALLAPGDLLVVNVSPTLAAAVDGTRRATGQPVIVHFATPAPNALGGLWIVELRRPATGGNGPLRDAQAGEIVDLATGGCVRLVAPGSVSAAGVRLWLAAVQLPAPVSVEAWLALHGRPIRYAATARPVGIEAYQTVFAQSTGTGSTGTGSAEMPSAGRPLSTELVTALVARGIHVSPITLHAGVSSLEEGETPPAERFEVPEPTAALVDHVHARGGRVIAVGTTVVRALETVADTRRSAHPGHGWTELVLGPERPARVVDGLLTGWHEPRSSHLRLLEAVSDRDLLERSYAAALAAGYRWHEFGDLHLLLR